MKTTKKLTQKELETCIKHFKKIKPKQLKRKVDKLKLVLEDLPFKQYNHEPVWFEIPTVVLSEVRYLEAELIRWKNSGDNKRLFCIAAAHTGVPLTPVVWLPETFIIQVIEATTKKLRDELNNFRQ